MNGVELRKNHVGTAIVLSILTLGIYWFILVYRNSMDIHRAAGKDTTVAVLLFIFGILFWIPQLLLFVFNGIYLDELRKSKGQPGDATWIVALVLTLIPFVGSIVWAVHYDHTIDKLSHGA